MIVTFLCAIDVPDVTDLPSIAEDIHDDLLSSGHDVQSVHPWARPNDPLASPVGGFTSLNNNPPLPPIL